MTIQTVTVCLVLFATCMANVRGSGIRPRCNLVCPEEKILNLTVCRCIPRHPHTARSQCINHKCPALAPPCMIYKRNAAGCKTCDCLCQCPVRRCSCSRVQYFIDQYGCQSCRCKPTCYKQTCRQYCAHGYLKDRNGCDICTCKPCGDPCKIKCRYGKLLNLDGCEICACKPTPDCGPVCFNTTCPDMPVLDENRCPTGQCRCGRNCNNVCLYGRVYDVYGCPTCRCLPRPVCRLRLCDTSCASGFVIDNKGCPTCQCLPEMK